ncbi:hypothetical protein LPB89_21765, partial [Flavobacterium sp. ENC]|nr:hypothetical protein [Flavobacterium sp. ENC]
MKLLRLLAGIFFLGHLTAHAQGAITAVATKAACVGDGTITITVTNVAGPITYAVAKLPYNEAAVITSTNPVITNLETGDYYYGYYSGTTFVKAAAAINVGSTYSTVSPTITSFFAVNYTYCGNDPDPLGKLVVNVSGGNPPYIISLLKASDESEVQRVTTSTAGYTFINVQPGTYKAKLMDNCGVTTTSISNVTLNANVTLKADDIGGRLGSLSSYVDVVYNTPGDICSGIKSAALSDGAGAVGYLNFISYITSPSLINVSNLSFVYKLEIQNGTGWDVYDNLTYTQLRGRFSLPADRSKWGLLRVTGTYCGISKTFTQDLGGSTIGKVLPFTGGIFNFSDDPASNICATTGKVSVQASGYNGCLPYTFEVTDNAANTKMIYTTVDKSRYVNFLLDIGKTYSFKLTDNTGTEVADYSFRNWTTNPTKPLPGIAGPNNVFIDPLYFSPAAIDLKSQISFYRRPSGINFNKSALAVIVPSSGFTGDLTASLINGPSPISFVALNASISGKKAYNLGENLTPGTYKIRIKDSGCFDEVFDVTVDCYFSKIEITSISAAPSTTICDRYVKTVKVSVSMVGTADSFGNPFIFSTYPISVQTVSGPVTGTGSKPASSFVYSDYLKDGSFDLVYQPEISGTYEIGLTKNTVSGFLPTSNLWEGTTTKTIKVEPNFPTFDLSQSGGIICTGNTTGNLYVKVDNTAGNATYFIKKDTDAAYPATGQTNPVFTGLTAGNYVVKAKTACYEVEQPLILRAPLSKVISGSTAYCDGGSVWLVVNQTGPVSSIKWTTPDGTVYNTADLKLDNLTPAQSGMYKVEVTSLGGCYFTESFNVNMNDPKTPTGASAQEFCKNSNAKVSDLKANEAGVMWYDAATGGTLVPATTPLINGKIYYGALQLGDCKSVARFAVTVTISDPQTPTTINTTQEFCKANNNTVADLKTTESGVTWYDDATGVNAIPSTTVLENNKVYYGSLKAGTCESPTRLAVTVTLSDPQTPTTAQTTQEFCKADHKTVADLQTAETGVTWYDAATAGTVVPSTTVFENNKIYYGSLKTGTCESPARLAVTVKVNDPKTPTGEENQQFCQGNNPKVSDLRTTESGVIWYDSNSNGNIIAPTTALENKIYWGVLKVGTCESQRLRVNVNISNPQTPTGSAGQEFCKVNNPKISDLVTKEGIFKQLNPLTGKMESVVRWYDAATGGNELTPDTALKNGTVYYGASRIYYGSLNNWLACDNPVRFAVTVTLSDPQTPTTVHTTQEFCKVDHKTVADLQTAETGVTWFDAEKEGNIVPPTTVLTNGTIYYGSLKIGTCESPTRLAVKVTLSDPQTPTTAHTTQEFCKVDNKTVADLVTNESDVTWYDAEKEGNVVPSTTVLENNKVYYGSLKVGTCESPTRLAVTVNLSDPKTPTTAQTTQEFCKTENKTVADLVTNESDVTWYDSADGTNVVPLTTVLENNKVYYGSLKAGNCESPTRLAVTVTLSDPQTPTTAQTTQEFCKVDNKTVADLVTTESGVTWYDSADGTTVVPLTTVLENNKVYYGSLKVGTCDSPTRLAVTVTLSDPQTPTTTHTTQEFCRVDNKTVADLVTNESDVTWYDAADGTTVVPLTTVLENNKVYYGSLKVGTCDSPTRLAVTVNLSDPKTPTTAYTTQEFCKADNKTVADLVTNESDVTWYDSADGITVVPSTTVLENNKMYYGSLKVGTCESPTRLAVTVILSDPQTPTTAHTTQEFCKVDNKTVADLVTNESDVTWYDSADGTTVVPLTTVLENNKVYYGSLKVGTCESPTRLAVTVNLSDPKTPTTSDAKQEFCKANNNTVADLKTNETGVTWYDSADGITVVPSTTVLENNKVYYGSLQVGTCESPTRLPVTVTLSDPKTPTTTHATQEFCKADNKTVADLVTTESGVTWYDSADGITVVPLTAVLENNKVYYGSLKVGTCESPTRLAVTVNLSDPQTPTTAQTTQEFCKADNKTVADLATTESDVTWYDSADGTTVVPSTTVLENNKVYYGSLKVGTCESP